MAWGQASAERLHVAIDASTSIQFNHFISDGLINKNRLDMGFGRISVLHIQDLRHVIRSGHQMKLKRQELPTITELHQFVVSVCTSVCI
jgi:hypothetical protein